MKKSSTENQLKKLRINEVYKTLTSQNSTQLKSLRKKSLNPDLDYLKPSKKSKNFSDKNEIPIFKPERHEFKNPSSLDHLSKKPSKNNEKTTKKENSNDYSLIFQSTNEKNSKKNRNFSDISGLNDLSCIEFRDQSFEDLAEESFQFLSQEKILSFPVNEKKTEKKLSESDLQIVPVLNETIVFQAEGKIETSPKSDNDFHSPSMKTEKNSPITRKIFLMTSGNSGIIKSNFNQNQVFRTRSSKRNTFPGSKQKINFCSLPKVTQNVKNPHFEVKKRKKVIHVHQKDFGVKKTNTRFLA
jgi:hypothetical protein